MSIKQLYDTLCIGQDAGADEIKKAYRKLAIKYHPDKNPDADAGDEFKKVTEAYTILSDPEKKKQYDLTGNVDDMMSGMPDMNDIFSNMFGNMFSQQNRGHQNSQTNQVDDILCELNLSEVYNGLEKRIQYEIVDKCNPCNGTGAIDPKDIIKCMNCNGRGHLIQQMGPFVTQISCNSCFGKGTTIKSGRECSKCKGRKTCTQVKNLKINVSKGLPNKFRYKVDGKGHWNPSSKKYNDIAITFVYEYVPDVMIDSVTGNIQYDTTITLEDLLCGFKKVISPYGKPIDISKQGYFNPSKPIVFKEKGLPRFKTPSVCGDVIVNYNIKYTDDERCEKYLDVFLKVFKREKSV